MPPPNSGANWCAGPAKIERDAAAALAQLRHRPLPTAAEALAEPFGAFPSWFMRITCDRCGKDRMLSRDARAGERPADP